MPDNIRGRDNKIADFTCFRLFLGAKWNTNNGTVELFVKIAGGLDGLESWELIRNVLIGLSREEIDLESSTAAQCLKFFMRIESQESCPRENGGRIRPSINLLLIKAYWNKRTELNPKPKRPVAIFSSTLWLPPKFCNEMKSCWENTESL